MLASTQDQNASPAAIAAPAVRWRQDERLLVLGILLAGLLHGLVYLLLVPPWQHYEEPSHFEHAWIIAETGELPTYPAYAYDKRREIVTSMIEHGFFRYQPVTAPDPVEDKDPVQIGVNVTGAPPLYPSLVSLALRLTADSSIEAQLYAARAVSLALYVLTILMGYCVAAELVPRGHPLRWAVPAFLALMPGLADLMTAVNNDVGATAVFSVFLWASVRMVRRGFSLTRLVGVLAAVGLCLYTKNTVLMSAPLAGLAVVLSAWSRVAAVSDGGLPAKAGAARARALGWSALGVVAALAMLGLAIWALSGLGQGDAALWVRNSRQETPTRVELEQPAQWGQHAIGLTVLPNSRAEVNTNVRQLVPGEYLDGLRGKTVTVGGWVWASRPVVVEAPAVLQGDWFQSQRVAVDTEPAFFAMPAMVDEKALTLQVVLEPRVWDEPDPAPVTVYYDGLILVEGQWPVGSPPAFADDDLGQGLWDGRPFENLVRNSSAEAGWPWVRPWAESLARRLGSDHLSPSRLLGGLLDAQNRQSVLQHSQALLFQTFWARFGWSNVGLPAGWYRLLLVATWIGVLGAAVRLVLAFPKLSHTQRLALSWLAIVTLAIWGAVLVRGLFTTLDVRPYTPTARYAYTVVIPTAMLLVAGWQKLPWPRRWTFWRPVLFWAAFVVFDIVSVTAIVTYHLGR